MVPRLSMARFPWRSARSKGAACLLFAALGWPATAPAKSVAQSSQHNAKTKKKKSKESKPAAVEHDSDDIVMTTTNTKGQKIEVIELEEEEPAEKPISESDDEARSRGPSKLNWVSLSVQQDSLIFPSTPGVCPSIDENGKKSPGATQYTCRDDKGLYSDRVYSGAGNVVSGGFGLTTTRVLVGYDRLFIGRLLAGARVGYAFREAPTVEGVGASLPLHVELRGAYFFGAAPFAHPGLRPFASLGLGLGEVDGLVAVQFYKDKQHADDHQSGTLHAWRKTGTAFVAPGGGVGYGIGNVMITGELRVLAMVPATAIGFALAVGGAYGF